MMVGAGGREVLLVKIVTLGDKGLVRQVTKETGTFKKDMNKTA